MIRLSTILRVSPAIWLSPIMVILTLLFMTDVPSWSDPYPLAWTSAGASAILIIAPICAACAAWEGGRLRRARWFAWPHVRSTTIVVLTILLPTLVVGLLMIVVALLFQIITSGFVFIPDWRVLSMAIIVLFAHVLLGFAMGVRIPIVVSLPMVFLLSFAWIELPNTLDDPLWLRHLSGIWTFCCLVSTNLAPQAWIGALLVAIGMISMASVLLLQRLRLWQALVSVVPLVIGVGVGAYMVQDLDAFPAVARDEGVLVCSTSQPRVCVWPEHETRLEEVAALATEASMAWRQVGVIVPDEFTEGAGGDRGIGSFGFSMETDRYTLFNSLSRSVLPPVANCEGQGSVSPREVQTYLVAWLNSVAGMPAEALVARANAQIRDTIATVQLLPLEEQQIWFERNLIALEQCGVPPQLEPLP